MEPPRWPKLCHKNPADMKEHAVLLGNDIIAVLEFLSLSAGAYDVASTLPKGIERKIFKGITKGLNEVKSCDYSTTRISAEDQDLKSNMILKAIIAEIAAVFHNRVPRYLFKILSDSYNELKPKILNHADPATQVSRTAGTASGDHVLPYTPPDSPPDESDFELSIYSGSDTETLAYHNWYKCEAGLGRRIGKLRARLEEVKRERKTMTQRLKKKATNIEKELREVESEKEAAGKRHTRTLEAMEKRRLERDRTGDYETDCGLRRLPARRIGIL